MELIRARVHEAPQGTSEWLRAREGVVTGTKISALMGRNPYCSADKAMWDHGELPMHMTQAMAFGTAAEGIIRRIYEEMTGNTVAEIGLATAVDNPRYGASADGVFIEEGVLGCIEIKTTGDDTDARVNAFYSRGEYSAFAPEHINQTHFEQIQWTMGILGAAFCDYVVYSRVTQMVTCVRIWFDEDHHNLQRSVASKFVARRKAEKEA